MISNHFDEWQMNDPENAGSDAARGDCSARGCSGIASFRAASI
jgi:hypothetical protein